MADDVSVRIEGDGFLRKLTGEGPVGSEHLLKDTLDGIADLIEIAASAEAPEGKTGELKEHPVDRKDVEGTVASGAFLFGGGFAVRGATGFVKGKGIIPGKTVSHIEISVAEFPAHAIWVHQGTGVFGPHETPIIPIFAKLLRFEMNGRKYALPSVQGQRANPYLERAYEYVDKNFVPQRVEELSRRIKGLF